MVTVKYIFLVSLFVQGTVSWAQQETTGEPASQADYGAYDYSKQYEDYVSKQYGDYVRQYGDYVRQYSDYGAYGDYGVYGDYGPQTDYGSKYVDFYYDDYIYNDDIAHNYGDYYGFGDRNNALDALVYDENGSTNMIPWVYIIVPVIQIDVFYVDDEGEGIENIDLELPIETFFFELGDFGMGHFGLGDFGLIDIGDPGVLEYQYDQYQYEDYPIYGHYPPGDKPIDMFDSAEELPDYNTLDYPGLDYEPMWVDWVFMMPADNPGPFVH